MPGTLNILKTNGEILNVGSEILLDREALAIVVAERGSRVLLHSMLSLP